MLDIAIHDVWIIDGSGKKKYRSSIGIKEGKIVPYSLNESARCRIDGTGLTICPGFIDTHSHGDQAFGTEYGNLCKTSQGITTQVVGHCGATAFPASADPKRLKMLQEFAPYAQVIYGKETVKEFTSFKNYMAHVSKMEHTTNYAQLIGHGALRIAVMGFDDRPPTLKELDEMKGLLRDGMECGAKGISSGLLYSPSGYAEKTEISELCRTIQMYSGVYATHMRNEAADVVAAVQEAIDSAYASNVKLNISHHKICGKDNWGLSKITLDMIEQAVEKLPDIWTDVYPYTASCSHLNVCLPPRYFNAGPSAMREMLATPEQRKICANEMKTMDGRYRHCGGFDGILIASAPGVPEAEGLFVTEYAKSIGKDPFDAYFDLILICGFDAYGIYFAMDEEDLLRIASHPRTMIATDGIATILGGKTHPRGFGAFPRAIDLFWRQKKLMSLEQLIKKMTYEPARHYMLQGKGLIAEGYDADLVLFDEERIKDVADYLNPMKTSEGIVCVINAGKIVYKENRLTGEAPGEFIPHNHTQPQI